MIKLQRAQIGKALGVDTTVKSSKGHAREFAPTWDMVMDYKSGTLSEEEYTRKYLLILDKASMTAWRWLAKQAFEGKVTVLCYCRDGWFCHTHLLMDYAVKKFPTMFCR